MRQLQWADMVKQSAPSPFAGVILLGRTGTLPFCQTCAVQLRGVPLAVQTGSLHNTQQLSLGRAHPKSLEGGSQEVPGA